MNEQTREFERVARCTAPPEQRQMTPWAVQGLVYELLTSFFKANSPESMGYPLHVRYDDDKLKSGIFVDVAYNYDAAVANKRPAIFVSRGDCAIQGVTMGHHLMQAPENSETGRMLVNTMTVMVSAIAAPVMMVELLADYAKQAFISFQQEIQQDFRLRRFRLRQVSRPQVYQEAKEYFIVNLEIEVVYDEGWILRRDDLKAKRISLALYDALDQTRLA
jgi:hypothetical protein